MVKFATAFKADKTANPAGIKEIRQLLGRDLDGTQKVGEVWAYQHANVVLDALGLPASMSPLPKAVREGCPEVYKHIKAMREILTPKSEIISQ